MKTILLTGVHGQAGFELNRVLPSFGRLIPLNRDQFNLSDPESMRTAIQHYRPDIIVNPAAYTAVDKAESEPHLAMAVNGIAPGVIAEEAVKLRAVLIHFSTDYVFNGKKPGSYSEADSTDPLSVYGRTKLAGEEAIRSTGCKHFIFRTSWVYSTHGGNFVKTVLRLAKERDTLRIVADQFGAPTSARLLASSTAQILQRCCSAQFDENLYGLYHLTARGETSWHRYAEEIVRVARLYDAALRTKALSIEGIPTSGYPLPAQRPANSVLSTDKVRTAFGLELPQWQDDLAECIKELYSD